MSDDDAGWLHEVARAAREGDLIEDPRWDAYAAGTLEEGEAAALRAEARAAGFDDATVEALGPRSAEDDEALAARLTAALASDVPASDRLRVVSGVRTRDEAARAREAARDAARDGDPSDDGDPPGDDVSRGGASRGGLRAVPGNGAVVARARPEARSRAAVWATLAGGAIALAAGVAMFLRAPSTDLPAYSLVAEGGEHDTRADTPPTSAEVVYGPGSLVAITMRPATRVSGTVAARAFLRDAGPAHAGARAWQVPIALSDGGVARIEGPADVLFQGVPAGRWEVVVAVGEQSALPAPAGIDAAESGSRPFALGRSVVRWRGAAGP